MIGNNLLPMEFPSFRRNLAKFLAAFAFAAIGCGPLATVCYSQSDSGALAIRVESREVQIPVMVADKSYSGHQRGPRILVYGKVATGLSVNDFELFEDGVEQQVQHVSVELYRAWGIVDNVSGHWQSSCTLRGIWAGPDSPPYQPFAPSDTDQGGFYLLSFVPPSSPEGSCHHIRIKVRDFDQRDVYARDQYCQVLTSPADPLNGSDIGKKMIGFADSTQKAKFPVFAQAVPFLDKNDSGRVDVTLDFPQGALPYGDPDPNKTMSLVGVAYAQNGTIAARFSDSACYSEKYLLDFPVTNSPPLPVTRSYEYMWSLTGYQNQLNLPPGQYTLKFVVTDGKRFGRAETPVTVDSYPQNELALSGIALCKRFHKGLQGQAKELRPAEFVPLASQGLEFTPAGDTRFQESEQLFAFFQIYEPLLEGIGSPKVQIEVKVTNLKTGKLAVATGLKSVDTGIQLGNPIIPVVWDLAAKKLRYGKYRLEVQASDAAGNKTPWRATTFSVE
jgi:hypothetical protein